MEKEQLTYYQKYIEILGIASDTSLPTIFSDSIQKKVQELEIEQRDWDNLKNTFQAYSARGKTYLDANNYQDAIEELEVAISLNPHDEKTLAYLAEAHAKKWANQRKSSDKQKAIAFSEKVLRLKPDHKQAVRIITELRNAPFQPWLPYKTWWLLGRWAIFLGILGGGYWYYTQHKTEISTFFSSLFEKNKNSSDQQDTTFDFQKITFRAGSAELNPQARIELDKLALYLKQNKHIQGRIACHTDNSGTPALNQQISEFRAKNIYDYLLTKGVNATQISFRGYGDTKPLVPNTSEENMQRNRRVEFLIKNKRR